MTKSSKKRKEKNADFVKPKLKLGKGKQPAANSVNTQFKARSIALPQQSIAADRDESKPTTKRKLAIEDLIAHVKHYSVNVRKDALLGLRELLEANPEMVEPNLLVMLNACVRLISDEDATVRKCLLAFFTFLLPRIPKDNLLPYSQHLLLFTTSALTNIFAEVRIDAVRMLDLLLDVIPEHVVAGCFSHAGTNPSSCHGRKVLDGYMSLLSASARLGSDDSLQPSTSSAIMLSASSKTIVLRSLSKFLVNATKEVADSSDVENASKQIPLWYMASSFSNYGCFDSFSQLLSMSTPCVLPRNVNVAGVSGAMEEYFVGSFPLAGQGIDGAVGLSIPNIESIVEEVGRLSMSTGVASTGTTSTSLLASLCHILSPILASTFLDCVPSVFSPAQASHETETNLVLSIFDISKCLFGTLLTIEKDEYAADGIRDDLRTLLGAFSPYFPYGENRMVANDLKIEQAMQNMSLIYSELFSLLFVNSDANTDLGSSHNTGKKRKQHNRQTLASSKRQRSAGGASLINTKMGNLKRQTKHVRSFVTRSLQGETQSIIQPMGQMLSTSTYEALLPTLWWLLNQDSDQEDDNEGSGDDRDTLRVIVEHAMRIGSNSGLKRVANEFVMRLVLLSFERHYRGAFRIDRSAADTVLLSEWLLHLPKLLWEIGDKQHATTELILRFFLRVLQRRSSWLLNPETQAALAARLIPYFVMQHPSKGQLPGPFVKLRSPSVGLVEGSTTKLSAKPQPPTGRNLKLLTLDVVVLLIGSLRSCVNPAKGSLSYDQSGASGDDAGAGLLKAVGEAVSMSGVGDGEREYWRSVLSSFRP